MEIFLQEVNKLKFPNTIYLPTYHIIFLKELKEQHNQKYHNMFSFFNYKKQPIQNHIIYIHHWILLYSKALYLYVLFHYDVDDRLPQLFSIIWMKPRIKLVFSFSLKQNIMFLIPYILELSIYFLNHQILHIIVRYFNVLDKFVI